MAWHFIETLHTARTMSHWVKNEIKSIVIILIAMEMQCKRHPYQDFLDFLDTV